MRPQSTIGHVRFDKVAPRVRRRVLRTYNKEVKKVNWPFSVRRQCDTTADCFHDTAQTHSIGEFRVCFPRHFDDENTEGALHEVVRYRILTA
jgi:hypothetical protein